MNEPNGLLSEGCIIPSMVPDHAHCPHGPMLLFEKRKDGKPFFACAAARDRKVCSFFLFADKKPSIETLKVWKKLILDGRQLPSEEDHRRFKMAKALQPVDRIFCQDLDCLKFIFMEELLYHKDHQTISKVTDHQMRRPLSGKLLPPLEDPKMQAQFVFSDKSLNIIVDILDNLKLFNVICLGTPRLYEALQGKSSFKSFLLDIDSRFQRFFSSSSFSRFNMFNSHFFSLDAKQYFLDFLSSCSCPPVVVVDPPFGGRLQPLVATLTTLSGFWINRKHNKDLKDMDQTMDTSDSTVSTITTPGESFLLPSFIALPYFLESVVTKEKAEFQMVDLKLYYQNHPMFQNSKKNPNSKGSPIRLFSNIIPSLITLPSPDYRKCDVCDRWVAIENRHCEDCKACTSKDGSTYQHCQSCGKCVKPNRVHCNQCNRCEMLNHLCTQDENENQPNGSLSGDSVESTFLQSEDVNPRCFGCGEQGHKRRQCPQNWQKRKTQVVKQDNVNGDGNRVKKRKLGVKNSGTEGQENRKHMQAKEQTSRNGKPYKKGKSKGQKPK